MRIIDELNPIYTYSSAQEEEGKEHLTLLCEEYNLCQKLVGLYDTSEACFHYQIHVCKGACIGQEPVKLYNARVHEAIGNYQFDRQNFFVIDNGRNDGESSVVKIENGKYIGFGYLSNELMSDDLTQMHDCIVCYKDNKEVRRIINTYIKKNKSKVVEY